MLIIPILLAAVAVAGVATGHYGTSMIAVGVFVAALLLGRWDWKKHRTDGPRYGAEDNPGDY